jgi:hypothetical protein
LAEIAAALGSDSDFATPDLEILTEDKGDIDTEIAQRVTSLGLCVTVMFSGASEIKPNLPGPVFGSVRITVEVCENALTNRSNGGRTSLEVTEQAARILHQKRLESGRVLIAESLQPFPQPPAPANVCYHLILRTSEVSIHRKTQEVTPCQ